MKCFKCGYPLPEDSDFCQYCGTHLENRSICDFRGEQERETELPSQETETVATETIVLEETASEATISELVLVQSREDNLLDENKAKVAATETNTKQTYCKRCGAPIEHDTKKCSGCGKQYFRVKVIIPALLAVLVVGLVGLNIFQYIIYQDKVEVVEQLKDSLTEKEQTISDQAETISKQETKISDLRDEAADLRGKNSVANYGLNFYKNYAAIIPANGTKRYHNFGCVDTISLGYFRIYDTAAANDMGYRPCPKCH